MAVTGRATAQNLAVMRWIFFGKCQPTGAASGRGGGYNKRAAHSRPLP